MTALTTPILDFVIIFSVMIFLIGLFWLLRNSFSGFSGGSYEGQAASGHFSLSDHFTTIDDLPEKRGLGQLMVKCRKCGVSYSSGIKGDFEIYRRQLEPLGNVTTTCPFCKQRNLTSPRNMTYTVS